MLLSNMITRLCGGTVGAKWEMITVINIILIYDIIFGIKIIILF